MLPAETEYIIEEVLTYQFLKSFKVLRICLISNMINEAIHNWNQDFILFSTDQDKIMHLVRAEDLDTGANEAIYWLWKHTQQGTNDRHMFVLCNFTYVQGVPKKITLYFGGL